MKPTFFVSFLLGFLPRQKCLRVVFPLNVITEDLWKTDTKCNFFPLLYLKNNSLQTIAVCVSFCVSIMALIQYSLFLLEK